MKHMHSSFYLKTYCDPELCLFPIPPFLFDRRKVDSFTLHDHRESLCCTLPIDQINIISCEVWEMAERKILTRELILFCLIFDKDTVKPFFFFLLL